MFKVVSCLAYEHDYSFVVVAAIVCVASAVMTIRLFDRAGRLSSDARLSWILLSAMACGAAIWTTHFVAMLGFRLPMDHAFDPVLTIASLLIAIVFSAGGLFIATSRTKGVPGECGGVVIGLGIVAMHFTGMAGLEVAGRIEWDWSLVAASVLFAFSFGTATTHILARHRFRFSRPLAMGLLVLAICTMHFTAMGAATLMPDPSVFVEPRTMSSEFLAVLVLAAMAIIAGLALYSVDARSQRELIDGFRHAALHDALTGLPNRAFLSANLPAILEQDRAGGLQTAVLVLDLDRFKEVNDVHGHHTGDFLLQDLSRRFTQLMGKGEMIARVGGDEFIAVKRQVRQRAEVDQFALRLVACVLEPLERNASTLSVGASVGINLSSGDCGDAEELIGAADLAMYRAKRSLGDKICYYEPSMDEGRRARSALAMELRYAIERDELELYYQPQLDVRSGRVSGYEALLRWHHRQRGIISPAEFIPIAEETGLIIPIGEWVLKTACAEVAGWKKPYRVAVNIASAQLTQADLPKIVHETLLTTGLPASRLELEITEASIIEDRERTLHVIRQLKALGVTIAMDDYGTGYSSLSTLQVFPFDKVKIDRSFIDGLLADEAATAIVKATILLASSLNIAVLAEGVERQEQIDFLQAEGCTEAQGFLFGRPRPLPEIAEQVGRRVKQADPAVSRAA
ncbi:putative bifunctional diguanylate cyclase/phosphodiesterase [Ollibium composti]|uniref:Bifunctional diguanylate cyclase/phosphodiesterase n=1 Tax=Ollibium composti TaxID=2675109 RepID=A0ABY2QBL5_9HYPH|nr:bifunctional diguanylate cyclase/phosphodiesterase [Mesorhizobium composti]THF58392.1 bifunctional diguanylate cyclase/phosphodiesterase [Mesorhizobium composti]